jgi:hypothetical protein
MRQLVGDMLLQTSAAPTGAARRIRQTDHGRQQSAPAWRVGFTRIDHRAIELRAAKAAKTHRHSLLKKSDPDQLPSAPKLARLASVAHLSAWSVPAQANGSPLEIQQDRFIMAT